MNCIDGCRFRLHHRTIVVIGFHSPAKTVFAEGFIFKSLKACLSRLDDKVVRIYQRESLVLPIPTCVDKSTCGIADMRYSRGGKARIRWKQRFGLIFCARPEKEPAIFTPTPGIRILRRWIPLCTALVRSICSV